METVNIRYTEAPFAREVSPSHRSATRTQVPPGAGIRALRAYAVQRWGITQTYTPGRSRLMLDGQRLDQHQWGHALDLCLRDPAKATEIIEWLIANAEGLGLQCVIAFGNRWYSGRDAGSRFGGYENPASLHTDHIHLELNTEGAEGRTSWFTDRAADRTAAEVAAAVDVPDGEPPIGDGGNGPVLLTYLGIAAAVAVGVAVVGAVLGAWDIEV